MVVFFCTLWPSVAFLFFPVCLPVCECESLVAALPIVTVTPATVYVWCNFRTHIKIARNLEMNAEIEDSYAGKIPKPGVTILLFKADHYLYSQVGLFSF